MCKGLRTAKMSSGQAGRSYSTDDWDLLWSSNEQDNAVSEQGDTNRTESIETKP